MTGDTGMGPFRRNAVLRDLFTRPPGGGRALCGEEGLTLIEILIAMFIFLIGIIGLLAVFPVALNSAGRTIGETRSNVLAQTVLAQVSADWKCPYYTDTVTGANPGTLTVAGSVPTNLVGYFVTMTSTATCTTDPAIAQSRIITAISGSNLSVCPDLNPLPLIPPNSPDTTPPGIIITKLALPTYPVGTVAPTGTSGTNLATTLNCRPGQWDGYSVTFTTGNWKGTSRRIITTGAGPNTNLTLDNVVDVPAPPVQSGDLFAIVEMHQAVVNTTTNLASVGMNLPNPSTGCIGPLDMNPRSGYVRVITTSTLPQVSNDTVDAGVSDPIDASGQHVIAFSWNCNDLWFKNDVISFWPSTGGSLGPPSTLTFSVSPQPADGGLRGCLAIIAGDSNNGAFSLANQARLITNNTTASSTTTLTVFPPWTAPAGTDFSKLHFVVREQPGYYFLVITSGKAAGRVFCITAVSPGAGANGADRITCAGVDFGNLGVKQALNPGGSAALLTDYVARNADTFTIIGVNGYPNSAYVAYSSPIDAAHPTPPAFSFPLYQLNAFGYPGLADLQTRSDVQTAISNILYQGVCTNAGSATTLVDATAGRPRANGAYVWIAAGTGAPATIFPVISDDGTTITINPAINPPGWTTPAVAGTQYQILNTPEAQTSDYSYACVFSGTGSLWTGPARADIFAFHNFNSALSLVNNQKPVGYLAGYIKRP